MNWTNVFKLPQPLAEAIQEDLYFGKREEGLLKYCQANNLDRDKIVHFSVGELIKSPRQVLIARRHNSEIIKDVATEIYRLLGTAIHYVLWSSAKRSNERHGRSYYQAEERLFYHFLHEGRMVVVSGEPDLVATEGEFADFIDDYKVTAVWSWIKGIKQEWEKQLNLYAMFRTLGGKITRGLRICYVLRDWKQSEMVQEGYPPAASLTENVKLWTFAEQQAFLQERIGVHMAVLHEYDDELPECTDEEMWAKEDSYAVKREGGKVASGVFSAKVALEKLRTIDPSADMEDARNEAFREADARRDELQAKLKGKEIERGYFVEHRPGERTKCISYCDAASFCSQYKEYRSVAFREKVTSDPV